MIKQKQNRKVTACGKRRTSFFELEKEVCTLKKQQDLQHRINAKQVQFNTQQIITTEEVLARLEKLERLACPPQAQMKKQNMFIKFRKWLLGC